MTFATAINCMDGRTQMPVIDFMKNKHKVDHIDMITEPGPNKILAENKDKSTIEGIKKRIEISVNRHGSKYVAVIAHHDCAGNPATKEEQIAHTRAAIKTVKSFGFKADVIGLWIDENWKVNEIKQ